ncbi:MAG TPA: DPP IV N-terminal domain-containing protein [Roseiflexaceae bacterium]|nr:DPP IV N-terminal domain-containing protein [Roseiflexaceae bacterium]
MRLMYFLVVASIGALLLAPVAPAQAAEERCFPETGYCIGGRFREYWEQNGGLPVFGYPIGPAHDETNRDSGQNYLTQWFERNRFELHPENGAPYDVLLGRLSDDRLRLMGVDWQTQPREDGPQPGCLWFEQTGHNVCNQSGGLGFQSFWQSHGLLDTRLDGYGRSLALFGLPITAATEQVSPTDGRVYMIQWFERARFEWHPDEPDTYKVLLGLLGNEIRTNSADDPGKGQIAFVRDGDLYVISAGGGNIARLTTLGSVSERAAWSPDAQWLAFAAGRDLYAIRRDGAQLTRLAAGQDNDSLTREPSWAPDNQRIVFERGWDLFVANLASGAVVKLTDTPEEEYGAAWSPDGTKIAFVRGGLFYVMNPDGSGQRQLTTEMQAGAPPAWSPDGSRLLLAAYQQWGNSEVYRIQADGSGLTNLTNNEWINDTSPAWSPDGTRIAFESNRHKGAEQEIYLMNADGGEAVRLTDNSALDTGISWSPDGAQIAFASNRSGAWAIYSMRTDGAQQTLLAAGEAPSWSPR